MEKERTGLWVCKILNDWSITSRQKNPHNPPGHLVVHPLRGGGIELSQSGIGMMGLVKWATQDHPWSWSPSEAETQKDRD